MKKIFLIVFIALLLFPLTLTPGLAQASACPGATGLVPCGQAPTCPCEINDFFIMLVRIYNFIVLMIATPLAIIAIVVGAIFMMISAGNPKWLQTGKDIFWAAVIGLVLVFCSWLIINFIMTTLGYSLGNWWQL